MDDIKKLLDQLKKGVPDGSDGAQHAVTINKMVKQHGRMFGAASLGALITTLVMSAVSELIGTNDKGE